jgi:hypothetical protein
LQPIVTICYDCIRQPDFLLATTLETEKVMVMIMVAVARKHKTTFACYCYCFCCLPLTV